MRVIVGMSGGVDSTIAAYILKKAGHDVIGVFLDFLGTGKSIDIDKIAKKLSIDIKYLDCKNEFKNTVIKYFVEEYKKGRTPNPCAYCNGSMKFKKLYEAMKIYDCDMIATGHYANVVKNDRYAIKKSANQKKDQSYMLYTLSQEILEKLILPIGNMQKEEVRALAKELDLDVYDKKDSQDVCFIKNDKSYDYAEFIKQYDFGIDYKDKILEGSLKASEIEEKPYLKKGEFVDKSGKVLGYHDGIIKYTIGQRKGLNISFGERKFVIDIDPIKNQVYLGDDDDLFTKDFIIKNVVWQYYDMGYIRDHFDNASGIINVIKKIFGERLLCKVRYRHIEEFCDVKIDADKVLCSFTKPVRAITKGQSAVFYDKEGRILFGGIIV